MIKKTTNVQNFSYLGVECSNCGDQIGMYFVTPPRFMNDTPAIKILVQKDALNKFCAEQVGQKTSRRTQANLDEI